MLVISLQTLKEVRKCAENWRIAEHVSSKVINICETDIQNSSKVTFEA